MNTAFTRSTGDRIGASLEAKFVLLLLFIAVAGQASLMAQSGGAFTATGNMTTPRIGHTAILLPNGKVLIDGGISNHLYPGGGVPASAELYDPSTDTFTATSDMNATHSGGTHTLLPDGRDLITGGGYTIASTPTVLPDGRVFFPRIPNASAQIYDPSTGTFTATGDMSTVRLGHTATLLPNGKVLIAGGTLDGVDGEDGHLLLASAELYDPSTGTFSPTGSMVTAQIGHKAILLPNGKVLIVDGYYGPLWPTVAGAELYDPSTGTFAATGDMTTQYYIGRTATLLTNGKVLIAGGANDSSDTGSASAELYDPSTGTFTSTGNMITGRQDHTATLLRDGTVLIAGSQRNDFGGGYALASAEIYDPATGTFSATGNMTTPRLAQTATLLADGTVLMSGGSSGAFGILASAELYHPAAVQGTPTVRIVDNNTGSRTTLAVGDSFSFQVTGAPPLSLVSVSEAGWSGSVGYTDASGLFWLNGIVGSNVVGTWQQTWSVGGLVAEPSPLQFTITPKP